MAIAAELLSPTDEVMLDGLQRVAFDDFVQHGHRSNGLVADTARPRSRASIVVVGFALSAYPVGVERGWMTRDEAQLRCLAVLRLSRDSGQSGTSDSTGTKAFYFHFVHMDSGTHAWRCEVSPIDTALLPAGLLTAARLHAEGIDLHVGHARFVSSDAVDVHGTCLRFRKALIATGARPVLPDIEGLAAPDFLTNESAFELTRMPPSLLVIDGDPLGCKTAQAFARFGGRSVVSHSEPLFLPKEERDAAQRVSDALLEGSRVGSDGHAHVGAV